MSEYISTKANGCVKIRMGSGTGYDTKTPMTVIDVFKKTVASHGTAPALKWKVNKSDEEFTSYTWQEYYTECGKFGKSLMSLGFEPFDVVNIIGFNSKEW